MGYASISPLGSLSKKDIIVLYMYIYIHFYITFQSNFEHIKSFKKRSIFCVPFGNDLDLVHCSYIENRSNMLTMLPGNIIEYVERHKQLRSSMLLCRLVDM